VSDADAPPPALILAPLLYHREVVAYLKAAEPELWEWASSAAVQNEQAEQVRTELLKANYRLDAAGHPELVQRTAVVAQRLGVKAPVTLYQSARGSEMNAMMCHLPGEAHIVFFGPILATLKDAELDAVLAHEIAHYRLWEMDGGDILIAERLLAAAVNDPRSMPSHAHTSRRFRLFTEVFADRGAYVGCGELDAAVSALIKTETGLREVSAASYLRQADEIFERDKSMTNGVEHPETFIRARALRLWLESDPGLDDWLAATISGPLEIDQLDLADQQKLTSLTRRLLAQLLRSSWFQTAPVLAHARTFFADFAPATSSDDSLVPELSFSDHATREYLCYLLLDFVAVDPELEEAPLAAALTWSDQLGLAELFEKLALKELGLGKRQLNKVKKEAAETLAQAEAKP
jgi:hypothetical protein